MGDGEGWEADSVKWVGVGVDTGGLGRALEKGKRP